MTQPTEPHEHEEIAQEEGRQQKKRPFLSTFDARKHLGEGMGKGKPVAEETLLALVERGIIHQYKREVGRGKLYDPDELDKALEPRVITPDEP